MANSPESIDVDLSYRKASQFPFRLRQNTIVYLEDRQFLEGFSLLNNILTSGTSVFTKDGDRLPSNTPFPEQLVLAATLVVHPQFTTRAKNAEDLRASNEALRFLRNVNHILGPSNAAFGTVLTFDRKTAARRKARNRRADSESTEEEDRLSKLESPFINEQSVFAQGQDFWQIVGWAFNCSTAYKKRWARWKLWLEFILDVLEADWEERFKQAQNSHNAGLLEQSIIIQLLEVAPDRTSKRRIMRAILADGRKSMAEFGEVWKDETKERKIKDETELGQIKKINIDEGEWGDYGFDADEDEVTDASNSSDPQNEVEEVEEDFGGVDALSLRQRLLLILATVAYHLPNTFSPLEELFDLYTEFMRPLSLAQFTLIITTLELPKEMQAPLLINTLLPFLAIAPRKNAIFSITQDDLIRNFLPFSANAHSVPENAKMSLLIQTLLTRLWELGKLDPKDGELRKAVETGIQARRARAIGDARTKDKGKNQLERKAKLELELSSEVISVVLDMLEVEAGMANLAGSTAAGAEELSLSSQLSALTEFESDTEGADDTLMG